MHPTGPGFEPGASRSRNLDGLVHRDWFEGFEINQGRRASGSTGFEPFGALGLLHELLHKKAPVRVMQAGRSQVARQVVSIGLPEAPTFAR